jgi:hypothetical protein
MEARDGIGNGEIKDVCPAPGFRRRFIRDTVPCPDHKRRDGEYHNNH